MEPDVQFEEEDLLTIQRPSSKRKKKIGIITRLAIAFGLAKDEQEAQKVLLVLAGLLIVFAIGFYLIGTGTTTTNQPLPASDINSNLQRIR